MSDEVLIRAEGVSKRFCKSLRRSMWYGMQGAVASLNPFSRQQQESEILKPVTDAELRKDEFWSLRDVSFELNRGQCLGLIGHNGAGKSTLLKILVGLIRPDRGRVTMRGRVAAMIELNAGFSPILTGRENIYNQGTLLGMSRAEITRRFDAIVDFSELEEFLDAPVQNYSSGMKVKLGFAIASQLDPDVLIIDEVLAVGDAAFRFKCLNRMAEIMRNSAVVLVSHSMQQITRVATNAMVLSRGRQLYNGNTIPDAVRCYYESQQIQADVQTGSGGVSVEGLIAFCADRKVISAGESLTCHPGEDIHLKFDIQLDQPMGDLLFQGLLWNEELIPAIEILHTPQHGLIVDTNRLGTRFALRLKIPTAGFNGGNYQFSLSVVSADYERIYCRLDNLIKLAVVNPGVSGAMYLLQCDWSVDSSKEFLA